MAVPTRRRLVGRPLDDASLAGATPYLRLFATATGGAFLAEEALAAARIGSEGEARTANARFFAEHLAPGSSGLEREVIEGADSISEVALA